MARQALYRKYRSKSLSEVVGQEHVTDVLESAIKSGVFSHAYLFTGPRGIGKTSVARIVAHMVNDLDYEESSFDIIEIDAASHGLKENIKDLIEKARIAPTKEKYKVYIVDEVHSMKHDAFNTFLKLLEEPPKHVIFILATTDPQKLPATILSRTQRFHFRPVEHKQVVEHLKNIAKKEKIDIEDSALDLIATRGEGSMRDSISLLDQLSGFNKNITPKVVEELLGLAPNEQVEQIVQAIDKKYIVKVNELLQSLRREGISAGVIINQLNEKLIHRGYYELVEKMIDANKSVDPWLKIIAIIGGFIESRPIKKSPAIETAATSSLDDIVIDYKKMDNDKVQDKSTPPHDNTDKSEVKEPNDVSDVPFPEEIDWTKIIEEAKKDNVPCGAWIALASYDYDGRTLTLYFRTKLQRSKMKEPKCWQTLRNALTALYDNPPEVIISEGPKPKSASASKVADIMGGGELL